MKQPYVSGCGAQLGVLVLGYWLRGWSGVIGLFVVMLVANLIDTVIHKGAERAARRSIAGVTWIDP